MTTEHSLPTRSVRRLAALTAVLCVACSPSAPGDRASETAAARETAAPAASAPRPAAPTPHPCVTAALAAEPVRGLDVSHHNGAVDWETVCEGGFGFVYLKASEGVDDPDPLFADHWRAAGALGLPRGAYHFYVTEDDPDAQADLFLSTLGGEVGELVPVVDVELIGHGTAPGLPHRLRRFLDRVQAELGVRPMIYTDPNFWDANFGPGFEEHALWVAEYGVAEPHVPREWEDWHLWQYAENRRVDGVEKEVDLNRVHPEKGLEGLRAEVHRAVVEGAR